MHRNQNQTRYILLSMLIVVPMGFLFKYYTGPGYKWFNDYGGDILYEIFWCLFGFWFFRSRAAVIQIPIWVFVITCIIEFLQLWHLPLLDNIRATFIGKLLLGTTFVWWDFPHYLVGCILGWLWLQQLQKIGYAKKSQS
ncbi:hypothetical protein VF14_14755 [Nostoc linckia z18]|jgi:hypothetical protein|uniref:DUF2809 domain-containing protein n=3 Tax=Nostoc TaxID=1177 RepID=A0A9Q5ZAC5_NOSLI|nr:MULTISPECIES: DUF2809 domain-containing protein [Nostoc]MBL1201642.1 DUF2809 domain-containing protein [Nostoc sp. GBBB01]PHK39824.1 hypothetical protein VF12_12865 [Nostoc linckia z15]PHK46560.1 hypothetical protein VF13_10175 [Nostoc linckia z16]MBC1241838.1 DUF2809 domain-containing protein [Nostoc sp. 2RC]MBD2610248.1 DUF2809 domain-containing protein [Nostoc punctiforme FACHB-252]